ncbi:hypothetical protein [uncultured Chryseobacterium sp.]|uniref:hypothetical protein n=1 Tax=uncultured Chryseobacterium sp. TaxID=259322 RepID=UPI0025F66473|nr:hypothetical protein [uncultured Chryseobacterium sp.]
MNTILLNNYKIEFQFLPNINEAIAKQTEVTTKGYPLAVFLTDHPYVNYLNSEIIPQINNILAGHMNNNLERGERVVLTIGNPNSSFTYVSTSIQNVTIPTVDLKEIILSWIEFLTNHCIVK